MEKEIFSSCIEYGMVKYDRVIKSANFLKAKRKQKIK